MGEKSPWAEKMSGAQPGNGQGRREGTDFPTEYNQNGLWIKEALPSIDNYGLHCLPRLTPPPHLKQTQHKTKTTASS